MKMTLSERRARIHRRIRKKVNGTQARPRLAIFRSNKSIYAQVIDDIAGNTLVSASSRDTAIAKATKSEMAKEVGKLLAERAKAAGINAIVFDRGGYQYHGRVKALADGAREGGLDF
jgi:large subunit ribosomal protein L18